MSVGILTLNSEERLERVVKSVADFADEVVVLDSGSADGTVELAKALGAVVFHRTFDYFVSQELPALLMQGGLGALP